MDINEVALKKITEIVETIIDKMDCPDCRIIPTMDRAEALKGADGVLCTVFNGDVNIWRHEIEIPKKIRRRH